MRNSTLFTFRLVEASAGSYAKVMIHNLRRRGEVVELVKGVYSFKASPYLVVKALPFAYIGLGSAALLHGAWNQVGAVTVLSPSIPRAARSGERIVAGYKVVLRRISSRMYFGYDYAYLEDVDEWVRVSDPEKTAIDLVYMRHPAREEMLPALLEASRVGRMEGYLGIMRRRRVRGWRRVAEEIRGFAPA